MEVVKVLHMNGGIGDSSYATNSLVQQKVILMTEAIREQALTNLYYSLFPKSLSIADLGCSSGPNTLLVASQLIKTINKIAERKDTESLEFQIYLNDLPSNDFNSVFKSLPQYRENLRKELGSGFGSCFITGVPGSFYERLFQSNSLHFVHSSYSLMWLSQVPKGLENNKGNIYMSPTSPPNVLKAYYDQFEEDFTMFLQLRSVELVTGGRMVLTILGRRSEDPCSKEGCYIWELLARVLNQMVSEGSIQEEKLDSFNIPQYTPSPEEVKIFIEKQGSFRIDHLEASEIHWSGESNIYVSEGGGKDDCGYNVAKCMRAVAEPLLVSHFGEAIIDEVFSRYKDILSDCMSKEKTEFINVTVSTTKIY